jgi:DNA polymerase-3 subunit beta
MNEDINKLKLKLETKTLLQALTFANTVVEKRAGADELSSVKMKTNNGYLEIFATDMDLYLKQKISCEILFNGEVIVAIKTLIDIVKKIPDREITLIVNNSEEQILNDTIYENETIHNMQLQILSKNCSFNLLTLSENKFPEMQDIISESTFNLPSKDLVQIIENTQFSISTEETRYNLAGIYLHVSNERLNAASTDGHRLSLAAIKLQEKVNDFGVILPKKTVDEMLKILKDSKNIISNVNLSLSHNKIKLICNDIILISKLIDGTFPDYNAFIPTNNIYKLTINTKILKESIDRVATITIDKFKAIKISFSKESIEISASGESKGAAKEIIYCSDNEDNLCEFDFSDKLSIGYNPKYLIDVLNVIKSQNTALHFSSPNLPTLIKIADPDREFDNFVVMPVKI